MTANIEFKFYKAIRNFTLAALSRAQHNQDGSLYSRNMSELGIHVSSSHSEHMFEPIVILRGFVKLLRMRDKSTHLYIYTYPYGKLLSPNYFTHRLWLLLAVTYLCIWRSIYIVNTVLNQCNVEATMLLHFCCFLLIQGESWWLDWNLVNFEPSKFG